MPIQSATDRDRRQPSLFLSCPLVLDECPWYEVPDDYATFLRRNLNFLYTDFLDQEAIDSLLYRRLFPQLRRFGDFDLVVVPLMAGAVLIRAAIAEFTERHGTPVVPLPISRHPGVAFLREAPDVRAESLRAYASYARHFNDRLGALATSMFGSAKRLRVLILEQTHHEGRVMLVIMDAIQRALSSFTVEFHIGVLMNEIGASPVLSPMGTPKVTQPDAQAVHTGVDTRSTSHLYYLLGHLSGAWSARDLAGDATDALHLWNRPSEMHRQVFALYPTPKLYTHERGLLDAEERREHLTDLWTKWSSLSFAPTEADQRTPFLDMHRLGAADDAGYWKPVID